MSRKLFSGSSQFIPASTTKTLHTGPGKIHQIITGNVTTTPNIIALYDHTAVDASKVLIILAATPGTGVINFPIPLIFTSALTVVTAADNRCFVITEAEA